MINWIEIDQTTIEEVKKGNELLFKKESTIYWIGKWDQEYNRIIMHRINNSFSLKLPISAFTHYAIPNFLK